MYVIILPSASLSYFTASTMLNQNKDDKRMHIAQSTLNCGEVSGSTSWLVSGKWRLYVLSMKYGWWTKYCVWAFVSVEVCSGSAWAWVTAVYSKCVSVCVCVHAHILWGVYSLVYLYLPGCVLRCLCICAYVWGACVCLIALVTQAVSHSHCSKLWVGEGHCGADRGDRKERGDGGWVGEKATEKDDNEKLKAVRKWDVGLRSSTILRRSMSLPRGSSFFLCTSLRQELLIFLWRTETFQLKTIHIFKYNNIWLHVFILFLCQM